MKNIAILASGTGSNAENIARYFNNDRSVNVALVLSNKATAGVHGRMKKFGIPSFTMTRADFDNGVKILELFREYKIDLIVLAGFMYKISTPILKEFPDKIINIHPSLLPKFGGKGMYGMHVHEAVISAQEKETGITIQYINEHYDEGAIIFQATCPIEKGDSAETVADKVHALEYKYYPEIISKLLKD